jgi:hypothetical protein
MVFEDEEDKHLVLTMLDTDHDGTVSLDEFKVHMHGWRPPGSKIC